MSVTVAIPEAARLAKARGGFYTPPELTEFLARWAIRTPTDTVLEPSAGDGAFLTALAARFEALGGSEMGGRILAIERDEVEAEKARLLVPGADVRTLDFFDLDPDSAPLFVAILGNPPYIRYHGFRGSDRARGLARAAAQGIDLSNLASSWAHFVVHATAFLEDDGRLGLVLPAELLHTDYAAPVRALLTRRFANVTVLAFDRAVFPTAQVDAVLLLASNDSPAGFRVVRVPDERALASLDMASMQVAAVPGGRWSGSVDVDANTIYEDAIRSGIGQRLGELAHVDIGFVSGANDFFVVTRERATELGLPDDVLTPAVRRPSDVRGLIVHPGDTRLLLDIPKDAALDEATLGYLQFGARQGIGQRFKCRKRSPWYSVPLPKRLPDAFLPYMHHHGPRLIVNCSGARNSNLLHGVALRAGAPLVEAIAVAMASSLTLLSAEIEGRAYGGGVLKLETKEAERLLVPSLRHSEALASKVIEVDQLVREGQLEPASILVDELLDLDHYALWRALSALRRRRLGRKRSAAAGCA